MARIWYVEVEDSGFNLPFLIVDNTEGEARKRMQSVIEKNKIANGRAKIKSIAPLTGRQYEPNVYRPHRDDVIDFSKIQHEI